MKKQKKISRKEKTEKLINKWAFAILMALCLQIILYLIFLNFVPTLVRNDNGKIIVNPIYHIDRDYFGQSQNDNGTRLIYYYNMGILLATILLVIYYIVKFMEDNEGKVIIKFKKFLKEQWPLGLLLLFMIWVFIGSVLAKNYYRSFVGCFNLKDGYLSFMMYASILVCVLLLGKNNEKYKKIIVNTFMISSTILVILSLWNYYYVRQDLRNNSRYITNNANTIAEKIYGNIGYPNAENFLIVTKRIGNDGKSGIFHNSNHYAYYLSICTIVAATLFMKEKKIWKAILCAISYALMVWMLILNNTFGSYLGVAAGILFMLIYSFFPKENNKFNIRDIVSGITITAIFTILSITTVNTNGVNLVKRNFSNLISELQTKIENEDITIDENNSAEKESNKATEREGAIGSGRSVLWEKAAIMALQKPIFGYGLENLKYEYDKQFGINEGRSHSLIFQLAATTGIIGLLLYVTGIAFIWIRKLKYIKTWNVYECMGMFVIVSYIVSSLTGNSAFYTSGYFYIFVGFVALGVPKVKNINNTK